ncbi:hypothetical protein [Pontibacter akesuensis]|uniref:DUF4369 domain-containing protein n=1 Tax=Pontibacter akesuensis TaxID=388950 RepID=A0A1I7H4M2_9BACT|nr:hypothetical protein [Pontibacter akesuensis]GHA53480.1 hypothetical protein GCM10007389_00820 [Pontibacter akesuensis]SFU55601.1 hypothetical protein SAMN04487941_1498 [Pontibacter akesuensis]
MKINAVKLYLLSLSLFSFALYPLRAQAQFRPAIDVQEWPAGKIVLTTGDTIYGSISFHRVQEIINVQSEEGNLHSFSPVNVQYFIAQEQPSGRAYTFRSLMWDQGRDYTNFKKPTFFEQLNQGPITLITRESYVHERNMRDASYMAQGYYEPSYYAQNPLWLNQIEELYYVLLPNDEIVTLRNVRKDLHRLFGRQSKAVKEYVKEHRLSYEKPHQVVAIVNYYNSLVAAAQAKGADNP